MNRVESILPTPKVTERTIFFGIVSILAIYTEGDDHS